MKNLGNMSLRQFILVAFAGLAILVQPARGQELFALANSGVVRVIDSVSGTELRNFSSSLRASGSIAFGRDGLLYGLNQTEGFSVYDPDTGAELRAINSVGVNAAGGIAFGPDGDLYAYTNQGYYSGFNPETGVRSKELIGIALTNGPIAFNSDGHIFGPSTFAGKWNGYDISTLKLVASSVDGTVAGHIAFDSSGLLYAQNSRSGFSVWNTKTGVMTASYENVAAGALAFGPDNFLYALNSSSGYSVYKPETGAFMRSAADGSLNASGDIAFRISPVPEMGTLSMAITGLFVLCMFGRTGGKPNEG